MNRVGFFDIAKGICLAAIVFVHTNVAVPRVLTTVMVVMFFFCSGFFFNLSVKSLDFRSFLKKKTLAILVPFMLYYGISYAMYYVLTIVLPSVLGGIQFSIWDAFTKRQLFNGPLWFFCAFYIATIIYYFIHRIKSEIIKAVASLCIGYVGFCLGKKGIFVPLWADVAMASIPFMYFGSLAYKVHFFELNIFKGFYSWIWAVGLFGVYMLWPSTIYMAINHYSGSYVHTLITGLSLILCLLFLCKPIKKEYIFTWISRNSMVIFSTHHLVYRPIKYFMQNPILVAVLTLVLEIPIVWLINRYIPILAGKYNKKIKQ